MSEVRLESESGPMRRRALLAGAGAFGATAVLAACGTDPDADTSATGNGQAADTPTSAPATSGDSGSNGTNALAKTSEIPVEGGTIFEAEGVVITQPKEGDFKAFSSTCTHQGCQVTSVGDGAILCKCHNSKFSLEDGSVQGGPASKPLPAREINVDGGSITLA
ncbi:Rieske (2Fe-2S) protein [Actinomycetes bacterium KLBMP 9797]